MERLDVTVYRTETEIIIAGQPDFDDETHNCDQMGCRQEHVLYRFPMKSVYIGKTLPEEAPAQG